ncbi:MAG: hypothetical protein AAFO83_04685 [Cyanobacteria bacterium J06607_13]
MFTKMMLNCTGVRRQLRRVLRFGCLAALGLTLSISFDGVVLSPLVAPSVAQVVVPNEANVRFETPGSNPTQTDGAGEFSDQVSNVVTYPLGSVRGTNNLGLNIRKTADKSAAEPGDVVVYRLVVTNEGEVDANTDFRVVDRLPRGVQYVDGSATGSVGGSSVDIEALVNGRPVRPNSFFDAPDAETPAQDPDLSFPTQELTLNFPDGLSIGQTLDISYATTLSPDSLRGNGVNVAEVSDGILGTDDDDFRLTIRPGILSDCGTIVGRVFADKNFDGYQQPGEAGIPNAVIFMDSGNRIITDPDGLFSMANVVAGNRVGALDLSSLPGYTLAPNLFRVEENSQSRLVRLSPGGLARMNFAVTPTFGEGEE